MPYFYIRILNYNMFIDLNVRKALFVVFLRYCKPHLMFLEAASLRYQNESFHFLNDKLVSTMPS